MRKRPGLPRFEDMEKLVRKSREGIDDSREFAVRSFAGPAAFVDRMELVRVAHVTDQHVGRVTSMDVQKRAIELINEGDPDVVVLTGDFVCHSLDYLEELSDLVAAIAAPTFAVLGNHDHWSGGEEVRRALRRGDVEVLDNAHTTLTINRQPIQIVGIDDAYTGHADHAKAARGLRRDRPTIGLSHIGEEADRLWELGVPMVFSGHTHAGQVTLAGLHEIFIGKMVGHKYVHGLYGSREAPPPRGSVYVGAGVGAGVIPVRIGERAKREVAFFELGVAPGAIDEHHEEQHGHRGRTPSEWLKARRARAVITKRQRREAQRAGHG